MAQKIQPLTQTACTAALAKLDGWRKLPKRAVLEKEYIFADFASAFGWMSHIALLAEAANHHPEWTHIYNRICVRLTTHEAKGITQRDIKLAQLMDKHYTSYS